MPGRCRARCSRCGVGFRRGSTQQWQQLELPTKGQGLPQRVQARVWNAPCDCRVCFADKQCPVHTQREEGASRGSCAPARAARVHLTEPAA
jgi:hypothetical protein